MIFSCQIQLCFKQDDCAHITVSVAATAQIVEGQFLRRARKWGQKYANFGQKIEFWAKVEKIDL
jgi:hypothetical protein